MSASTDNRGRAPAPTWRPAGALYLALLLAATAAGMWPDAVYPSRQDIRSAPLPTLRAVGLGQVAFVLLVYPAVLLGRAGDARRRRLWPAVLIEPAVLMLATVPFYVVAAWLADAVPQDAVRLALYVAGLWAFSAALAAAACRFPPARAAAFLLLGVLALGLPAAWYVAVEFLAAPASVEWLWQLGPATAAWDAAAARDVSWLPRPLWAALVWPGAAAALICAQLLRRR